jgi:hypothetical protein
MTNSYYFSCSLELFPRSTSVVLVVEFHMTQAAVLGMARGIKYARGWIVPVPETQGQEGVSRSSIETAELFTGGVVAALIPAREGRALSKLYTLLFDVV